jgi:hypothetical protein
MLLYLRQHKHPALKQGKGSLRDQSGQVLHTRVFVPLPAFASDACHREQSRLARKASSPPMLPPSRISRSQVDEEALLNLRDMGQPWLLLAQSFLANGLLTCPPYQKE